MSMDHFTYYCTLSSVNCKTPNCLRICILVAIFYQRIPSHEKAQNRKKRCHLIVLFYSFVLSLSRSDGDFMHRITETEAKGAVLVFSSVRPANFNFKWKMMPKKSKMTRNIRLNTLSIVAYLKIKDTKQRTESKVDISSSLLFPIDFYSLQLNVRCSIIKHP